jgi:2-polyprenyl-3-methyl-5-hydroxy-6-metoxy-1,4-benzoquinol methylase
MNMPVYDASFYSPEGPGDSLHSANVVVPLVNSMIQPESVVDVGCGSGVWLSVFREHGVKRILAIEGSHVDANWLRIPRDCIKFIDLCRSFESQETFDLALCLEVAEHLPAKSAQDLIQSLV